jgi:chlorophyll synthase
MLLSLVIPQITLQNVYFISDYLQENVKYQSSAQPFLILGILAAGLALGRTGI